MKKVILLLLFALLLTGTAKEIENFQFTDVSGKEYDLYEVLERGTYIYIYSTTNG